MRQHINIAPTHNRCVRAFSLVELSIVLVILGLLTGGILAGQSLIRAAELRSIGSQWQKQTAAVLGFRDKYFALPGDITNATSFWTAQHATPATCWVTPSTSAATCDGNGDGNIGTMDGGTTWSERFRAWQHLANAGLVEGSYSGVAGPTAGGQDMVGGTNVPTTKINGVIAGLWGSAAVSYSNGNATYNFAGPNGLNMLFGVRDTGYFGLAVAGFATPSEVWNIDVKYDDGKASTGRMVPTPWPACTNAASQSDFTGDYLFASTTRACAINFRASL